MADFGAGYLAGMFGVVAFGAVVPVLPTGAAVSVAAVLAEDDNALLITLVVLVGAAGAYVGDLVTYAILRWAGQGLLRRVRWLDAAGHSEAVERVLHQLETQELRTLLLSRLVPAGRIPVLAAAAVGGYSWRRYVSADIAAALLWSAVYAAIGLLGKSIFPKPWQGVVAAIVLVLLVSLVGPLRRRLTAGAARGTSEQ